MAKLLENTFRHVNIALVNEMVRFCDDLDIDLWDAIDCAETKPFGYMAFRPGPGVGGHCIPVDPSYLSHRVKAKLGYAFRLVELAEEINTASRCTSPIGCVRLLNDEGKSVKGVEVLLLGVTYKPDISDRRESPADPLAERLLTWGADLAYHDPYVPTWEVRALRRVSGHRLGRRPRGRGYRADVVVLLQRHREYDLPTSRARHRICSTPVALSTRARRPAASDYAPSARRPASPLTNARILRPWLACPRVRQMNSRAALPVSRRSARGVAASRAIASRRPATSSFSAQTTWPS